MKSTFLALGAAVLVLAACNNRGRTRVPGDSGLPVDSSAGDAATDSSADALPTDSDGGVDSSTVNMCGPTDAAVSTTGAAVYSGSNVGQMSRSAGSCGGGSAPETIVVWTAPTSGLFNIDTVGSDFDTVLYVRGVDPDVPCGPELACDDDTSGTTSEVTVEVSAGTEYFIIIDGFSDNAGNFVLNVNPAT